MLEQAGLDKALADFGAVGAHTKELLLSTDWVDYFMGMMQLTNAAGEVINAGITPDVELVKTDTDGQKDYPDFYNLDLLSDLMNVFYVEKYAA